MPKILGALGRTLAKPVTAPASQIARSASNIAGDLADLAHRRQAQADEIEAQARVLRLDEIDDAAARFETVARARGLTERDIEIKLRGVRRNRRIFVGYAAALGGSGMAWLLWAGATQAGLIDTVAGVCLAIGGVMAAAQAFRLGLGQHQLEERRLDPVSVYFSREDLFWHWLGW